MTRFIWGAKMHIGRWQAHMQHMDEDVLSIRNKPDQHAFVMLGVKTLFLCHLTMFAMEDHMYQLVVRARLPDYAMHRYLDERATPPLDTFFLGNSENDLMTVPELQTGARSWFIGDVFRGIPDKDAYTDWPWKDVTPIIKHIPVTIERIVYYRHFDFNLDFPEQLTYVLFGSGEEAHLTHYQVTRPDFDHVLSLAEVPDWLPPQQLEAGVPIMISIPSRPKPRRPNDRSVYCSDPLTNDTYPVKYAGYDAHDDTGKILACNAKLSSYRWFSTKIVNLGNDPCVKPTSGSRRGKAQIRKGRPATRSARTLK